MRQEEEQRAEGSRWPGIVSYALLPAVLGLGQLYPNHRHSAMKHFVDLFLHPRRLDRHHETRILSRALGGAILFLFSAQPRSRRVKMAANRKRASGEGSEGLPLSYEEKRFQSIFEHSEVSLWEEDISALRAALDELRARGVRDMRTYLDEHPEFLTQAARMITVINVNEATLRSTRSLTGGSSLARWIGRWTWRIL